MSEKLTDKLVYRIIHYDNLNYVLEHGMYVRQHKKFDANYVNIGNSEIIDVRKDCPVKITGYGFVGDYVPFYFGTQSIMLYNILTGHGGLQKHTANNIIYLCCRIEGLIEICPKYFFTDGQANKQITAHFSNINDLNKIDWNVVNGTDFRKSEDDPDKARRYQAEFLVHQHVPVNCISKIVIHNKSIANTIQASLIKYGLKVPIEIAKKDCYYFYF